MARRSRRAARSGSRVRVPSHRQRIGDRVRCGEGAEVGGAGGVVGGADAEVEVAVRGHEVSVGQGLSNAASKRQLILLEISS